MSGIEGGKTQVKMERDRRHGTTQQPTVPAAQRVTDGCTRSCVYRTVAGLREARVSGRALVFMSRLAYITVGSSALTWFLNLQCLKVVPEA